MHSALFFYGLQIYFSFVKRETSYAFIIKWIKIVCKTRIRIRVLKEKRELLHKHFRFHVLNITLIFSYFIKLSF